MDRRRDPLLIGGTLMLVVVGVLAVVQSRAWVDRTFPGFLLMGNRVVASAGLVHWPATRSGELFQHEVVAVDGEPLADAGNLLDRIASEPPGTPVHYRFRGGGREFERTIETQRFQELDYVLLFGALLLSGFACTGTALAIRFLKPGDPLANAAFPVLFMAGMFALTATDLYGPHRLFRLHALSETLLFPTVLHMAFGFPQRARLVERHPALIPFAYAAAGALALVSQAGLYRPSVYVATHLLATSLFGAAVAVLLGAQVRAFLRPPSFEARQRVKVLALGSLASLTPPVLLNVASVVSGGQEPQNLSAVTGFLFPLSVGYAVVRHNLLEVDILVRRSLGYAVLTLAVAGLYAGSLATLERLFHDSAFRESGAFALAFAALCVMGVLPARDRIQSGIDRLFFRTSYDYRRIVEATSAKLASFADLDVIALELSLAVREALHAEWIALYVRSADGADLEHKRADGPLPSDLDARVATALSARFPVETGRDGALAVPFRVEGDLVALLLLGRSRSGHMYGGDDRRLLQTLAHQGAVAIENALALERLRDLNRSLEDKVVERTRELESALRELRQTQAQLVHREKMASVGQFVAGIAHEINNPLSFIQGNLHYLRQYSETLVSALGDYEKRAAGCDPELASAFAAARRERGVDEVLEDLALVFEGCAEGVQRTTTLVRDLRTFSRLDEPERLPVDLHEALDSTLNLLRGRLATLRVVREYARDLPAVDCLAGQINQVFMNLLANAADAVGESGTIRVRTQTLAGDHVAVEVEDDGCGIEAEKLSRIFDPFFTTKEVGKGTGLGLSISYGIVERHGGTIRVRSEVGRGTTFRVELPVRPARVEDPPFPVKPAGQVGR
jgi:signal transduction histidine kinase